MSKPLLGLTCYSRNEDNRFTLPANYLEAVERAGGSAVILAPTTSNIPELLDQLDGVILTGGADIDPDEYGGTRKESVYGVDAERDHYELQLTRDALQRGIPMMAICRGLQVLNVALGGTLVEHIPDEYGESVVHRGENLNKVEHSVTIDADSRLAAIIGQTQIDCPSYHHQSIRDLAPQFKVVARSPDTVVEAIESSQFPGVIAVQWHPEYTAASDPCQQQLFDTLVCWAQDKRPASDREFPLPTDNTVEEIA